MSSAIEGFDGEYTPLRQIMAEQGVKLPKPEVSGGTPALSTCGRFWAVPKNFINDKQLMLFLVLFFGVATQAFSLGGGATAGYIPYLSIASSPIYLIHAMRSTIKNFKMAGEAGKTKRVADGVFYLILGLSSFGTAFGDVIKPLTSGVQLAGISHRAMCALIFGKILPIVMVAAGSISGLSAAAQLWRSQAELQKLKGKVQDPDFDKLVDAFEFIRKERTSPVDEDKRVDLFVSDNPLRKELIDKRLAEHKFTYSCPLKEMALPHDDETFAENQTDLLHQVQNLFRDLLNDDIKVGSLKSLVVNIEKLMKEHSKLFAGQEIEAFKEALRKQKAEIDKLEDESLEVIEEVRAELHRKIAGHAIMLFLAVLTVTGGLITTLTIPHHKLVGGILIITGCTSGMGNVLFDRFVTHKQYLKMDKWLHARLPRSA